MLSRKNLVLLAIVIVVATPLSIFSYQYSQSTSERIQQISIRNIQSNTEIQAHDLANSLSNKLADSLNTIEIVAGSPAILQNDLERAKQLLSRAQHSTDEIVDFYMWLDQDGKVTWSSSFGTSEDRPSEIDLSYRQYFSVPKENHQPYYSSTVESSDEVKRLYISYPILAPAEQGGAPAEFRGVIVAAIRTETLGDFLEDQLSPNLQSEVALLDNTGIILHNQNEDLIGKNVFGARAQSYLASIDSELLRAMNAGISRALIGDSGLQDVPIGDSDRATFVYKPILLDGKQFGVLFMLAPHTYAEDVASLIDRQENLSVALIIIVLASAVAVIVVIFVWNSRLEQTVRARTVELSAANEQLLTHDRLQKEFINIAAHELRTPIQPLLGVAEMLEHQFKDDAKQEITISKPEVDMIMRNASRLANLSAGILEVSRIESNTLKLTKEPIDLKAKLETIVHDMQSILPLERNIKLRIESRGLGSNQPVLVSADRERLYEVISNLLSNAIKFTPVGEVSVILEPGENEAQIAVKVVDTGRGIDPEMLPRLFTKFATNSEMGTGLGLYIAKSIIEAHGGKIWAKNNEDKGATFAFSLPIIQAPTLE